MINGNRPSDDILNRLNRIYDAKLSGALVPEEFPKLIIRIGDLFANQKHTEEEIESFEALIPNENVFLHEHEGLAVANNTVKQNNKIALVVRENKFGFTKRI